VPDEAEGATGGRLRLAADTGSSVEVTEAPGLRVAERLCSPGSPPCIEAVRRVFEGGTR